MRLRPLLIVLNMRQIRRHRIYRHIIIRTVTTRNHIIAIRSSVMYPRERRRTMINRQRTQIRIRRRSRVSPARHCRLILIAVPCLLRKYTLRILLAASSARRYYIRITWMIMTRLLIVRRIPLPPDMLVTPSITLAERISPLKVAGLVARRIRMPAVRHYYNSRTSRLIRDSTAINGIVLIALLRIPMRVHVCRTRSSNLITRRHLIIELRVKSNLLINATINRLPRSIRRTPKLIALLLSRLCPMIKSTRNRTMIRTVTAINSKHNWTQRAARLLNSNSNILIRLISSAVNRNRMTSNVIILQTIRMINVTTRILARPIIVM